jgi:NAD(P)-dependent dehydrogenase (short-subunit alcohol dehydrogenase family)
MEKTDSDNTILEGKVALITGGARGLGMAMAEGYLQAGAHLSILDRDASGLHESVKELSTGGAVILPVVADIRSEEQIDNAVLTVLDRFGHIDILINNAAVLMAFVKGSAQERPQFWDIPTEIWKEFWEINMMGTWLFCRRVAREMMKVRSGSIINITTSPHTMISERHIPYGPSKAAIDAFTKAAAKQLSPYNVRMNALYPGDTEIRGPKGPKVKRMGRSVMVSAAIYLGSDVSTGITGKSISAFRFNAGEGIT